MKRKLNISLLILLSLVILGFNSCKKDKTDPEDDTEAGFEEYAGSEVYVAGDLNTDKAVLWKNGKPTYLLDKEYSGVAHDITAFGADIYVVGMTSQFYNANPSNSRSALFWKNNQPVIIDKTNDTELKEIVIAANGDIYVEGNSYDADPNWSTIWKNGKLYPLQTTGERMYVNNMITVGNDFYAAGNFLVKSQWFAIIWKNGKILKQYPATSAVNIATNGTDIFYHVRFNNDPETKKKSYKVYKNQSLLYALAINEVEWDSAPSFNIFQAGNDNYVASAIGNDLQGDSKEVRIWKNGKKMDITKKGISHLTALYVKGADVYYATLKEDEVFDLKPELYKNNQLMPVDYDNLKRARFNSIYVR